MIGSDLWSRLGLGVVVFFVLYALSAALGLADGKVGLPFGLQFDRSNKSVGADPWIAIGRELQVLQSTDRRVFEDLQEVLEVLQECSSRLDELEHWRAGEDGSSIAGGAE